LHALRKAAKIRKHKSTRTPPANTPSSSKKKQKTSHQTINLFASPENEGAPPSDGAASPGNVQDDAVTAEVEAWAALPQSDVDQHRCNGLVDEFALMSRLKKRFPLHHTVFRQSSSLLCHEGNVEQVFSIAKHNSDPNMRPRMLRLLTKTGINKSKYKPTVAAIWKRYQEKYKVLATYCNSISDFDTSIPIQIAHKILIPIPNEIRDNGSLFTALAHLQMNQNY
jgi:hypothetical protein